MSVVGPFCATCSTTTIMICFNHCDKFHLGEDEAKRCEQSVDKAIQQAQVICCPSDMTEE